jgi:hypothetical protein
MITDLFFRKERSDQKMKIGWMLSLVTLLFSSVVAFGQNGIVGGMGNGNWAVPGDVQGFGTSAGTSRIYTKSGATGDVYWRFVRYWSGNNTVYGPSVGCPNDETVTSGVNTNMGTGCTGKAFKVAAVATNNYVFKTPNGAGTTSFIMYTIEGAVQTVTAVSVPTVNNLQCGTITATLSGALSAGQGVFLRYSTDAFATSKVVKMDVSGTSATTTLPSLPSGTVVQYYVFTSGDFAVGSPNGPAANGGDADYKTINFKIDGVANYTFTVTSGNITGAKIGLNFNGGGNVWRYTGQQDGCDASSTAYDGAFLGSMTTSGTLVIDGASLVSPNAINVNPRMYWRVRRVGEVGGSFTAYSLGTSTACGGVTHSKRENTVDFTIPASNYNIPGNYLLEVYHQVEDASSNIYYMSNCSANYSAKFTIVDPNDGNIDPTQANASGIYETYFAVDYTGKKYVFDGDGNYNSANSTGLIIPTRDPGTTMSVGTEAKVFHKGNHKVCGCSSWVYSYDVTESEPAPTIDDFPLPANGTKTGWDGTRKIGKFSILQHSYENYDGSGNQAMEWYQGAYGGTQGSPADSPANTTDNSGTGGYNANLIAGQTTKFRGFTSSNPTDITNVRTPVIPISLATCTATYRVALAYLVWIQTGAGKACPYTVTTSSSGMPAGTLSGIYNYPTVNSDYTDADDLATIVYQRDVNLNKTSTAGPAGVTLNPAHPQNTAKRYVKKDLRGYLAPFATLAACEASSGGNTYPTGPGTCGEKVNSLTDNFYTFQVQNRGTNGTYAYQHAVPGGLLVWRNSNPTTGVFSGSFTGPAPTLTDDAKESLMISSLAPPVTLTLAGMGLPDHIVVNNLAIQQGVTLEIQSGQSVTVLNNVYTIADATFLSTDFINTTADQGNKRWDNLNNNTSSITWNGFGTISANKNPNDAVGTGLVLVKNGGNFIQKCEKCVGPRIQLETQTRTIANHAWVHRSRPIVAPANTTYGDATKQDKRGQNGSTTINGVNYANELFNNTAGVNTTNNVQIKATATTEAYLNNNVSNADVAEYKNNIFRLVGSSWNAVSGTSSTIAPGEGWIIRTGGRRFWDGAVDANQVVTKASNVGGNIPYPYTTAAGLSLFGTKTLTARDMVFRGQANNGVYLVDISATTANAGAINHNVLNGQVLLGNPYPSAIDAQAFLGHGENSEIASAIYTWTSPRIGEDGKYPHASSFAVYNLTGGTTVDGTTNGNTSFTAGRYIAPGQGFQVQKLENGNNTLRFENSMRVGAPESTDGRKFARTKKETSTDKRVWVSLTNKFDGNQANILVGYVKNSTRAYDRRYDAVCLESPFKLYSKIDSSDVRELSIQGKGDFDKDDKVILGIVNNNPKGENKLTLKLEKTEGLENTEVILKDKTDKKEINLSKEGEYTFALKPEEKVVENRFEIVYNVKEIVTEEAKEVKTEVALNKGQVLVKSAKEVSKVEVYDLTGRLVRSYSAKGTSFAGAFNAAKSSYIVKVTASNGEVTSHKVSNE